MINFQGNGFIEIAIMFVVVVMLDLTSAQYSDASFLKSALFNDDAFSDGQQSFDETFTGTVGGSNYTYYSYSGEGAIRITLISITGDVDLYVGEKRLEPTFDLDKHALQSITCGVDVLDIPSTFGRPVGIGIYGHPSHVVSTYVLKVGNLVEEVSDMPEEFDYWPEDRLDSDQNPTKSPATKRSLEHGSGDDTVKGSGGGFGWEIALGLLGGLAKILLEILS